jgi:hypothetical protein
MGEKIMLNTYIIPTINEDMRTFVSKFKLDMMDHAVDAIRHAVDNNLDLIEVYNFKDSPYVVTITKKEFEKNIEYIYNYCFENENYEVCGKIKELQKRMKEKNEK